MVEQSIHTLKARWIQLHQQAQVNHLGHHVVRGIDNAVSTPPPACILVNMVSLRFKQVNHDLNACALGKLLGKEYRLCSWPKVRYAGYRASAPAWLPSRCWGVVLSKARFWRQFA